MKQLKIFALAAMLAGLCPAANVTIAHDVSAPYKDASNRVVNGTWHISWQSYSTGTGVNVAAGSIDVPVVAGVFSVTLASNDTADPPVFYSATCLCARATFSQQWVVPAVAGPVTVNDVTRSSLSPITIVPSQISKVGAVAGDLIHYNGSSWVRLPIGANTRVLTVDTSLAGKLKWAADAASGAGVWGFITGALADQPDLVAALLAKQNALGYTPLNAALNLADLPSVPAARISLGLGTAALSSAAAFEVPLTFAARLNRTVNVIDLASGVVTAGTCGDSTHICGLTYDTYGRVTGATNNAISLTPLTFSSPLIRTGSNVAIQVANASQPGYIASADWSTFNGKQDALGFTPEPAITGGTSAQVWLGNKTFATLNTALVPELTNLYFTAPRVVSAMAGLYEAPLTFSARVPRTANAIDLQSGVVTPGSCGDATHACGFTYDTYGRVTAATNTVIAAPPSGAAGGDLGGTYPNPSVTKINGVLISGLATAPMCNTTGTGAFHACTAAEILALWTGVKSSSTVMLGDGTMGTVSAAFSGVTAGTNAAALIVGTGGSLGTSGSGTIDATSLGGSAAALYAKLASPTFTGTVSGAVPISANALASNGSGQAIAGTAHHASAVRTCVAASASTTNYTCSTTPTFTPATGDLIYFLSDATNSSLTVNLNVNSQGDKLVKSKGTAPSVGDVVSGQWYILLYDGTVWNIAGQSSRYSVGTNFVVNPTSGAVNTTGIEVLQASGSVNSWQIIRPDQKQIGIMGDHQFVSKAATTGSWFAAGAVDLGFGRCGTLAWCASNGTQGNRTANIIAGVTASDNGCTTTADIGRTWFDITTTTTVYKVCLNVAGTLTWVTK